MEDGHLPFTYPVDCNLALIGHGHLDELDPPQLLTQKQIAGAQLEALQADLLH